MKKKGLGGENPLFFSFFLVNNQTFVCEHAYASIASMALHRWTSSAKFCLSRTTSNCGGTAALVQNWM